jgi:hypothetical protein
MYTITPIIFASRICLQRNVIIIVWFIFSDGKRCNNNIKNFEKPTKKPPKVPKITLPTTK